MAAGNSSTAFHQTVCRTARLHSPSERDEGGGRERRGDGGVRRGEEDETGGGGGSCGLKRGRPKKTDATTVAMALLDINSPVPHCANLIGNVGAVMLCLDHTLASK